VDDHEKVFSHFLAVGKKQVFIEQRLEELTLMVKDFASNFEASMNKKLQDLNNTVNQPPTPWAETMSMHAKMTPDLPLSTPSSSVRAGSLDKKYEELERSNKLLSVRVSELELQLQASLASTHNGAFLWRIPDVARRKRDAIDERITSIYSPPFYTGRNGYKMCIRAYLNGDGIGHKTHLSIFFVLMKGEYDPLLKWPFDHKVSLILVDQNHRKHIVQTFKPTQDSSSFQRPRTDMNVASGCPQFSKLDVLEDPSYVKDDVMYIKCIIDTSRIFHP
jgi:TNF receptor-associated factor 2/TNF receptor-associated factor 3